MSYFTATLISAFTTSRFRFTNRKRPSSARPEIAATYSQCHRSSRDIAIVATLAILLTTSLIAIKSLVSQSCRPSTTRISADGSQAKWTLRFLVPQMSQFACLWMAHHRKKIAALLMRMDRLSSGLRVRRSTQGRCLRAISTFLLRCEPVQLTSPSMWKRMSQRGLKVSLEQWKRYLRMTETC